MIEYTVKVYLNGDKIWHLNGKLHREDGPACEYGNGIKCWHLDGYKLTKEEFLRRTSPELQVIKDLSGVAKKYGYKLTKEGE